LTLDRVILHTVVHDSSTSTYKPNFTEMEETFCGQTDGFTKGHFRPALLGRLCRRVNLKMGHVTLTMPLLRVVCHPEAGLPAYKI